MELGIGLAQTLAEFSSGVWTEVSSLLADEQRMRRLRICMKNGWVEEKSALQGDRWTAYRLTPRGMAALDQFRIIHGAKR